MKIKFLFILLFASLSFFNSCEFFVLEEVIDASNPVIKYSGRFDFLDSEYAKFSWSGVSIETVFEGTSIALKLIDGNNDYNIFIDGNLDTVLTTTQDTIYTLAENLHDTLHHILITKRTEASLGEAVFGGFIIDPDKNFYAPKNKSNRKIEFIGDSYVAGFGIEGSSPDCQFSRETENNYLSYGPLLARRLNAEYFVEAISGIGIVRNYGDSSTASLYPFPYYFEKTNIFDSVKWDFTKWVPDIVVVRLGRNDFWTEPYPTQKQFETAYKKFIISIRGKYPKAEILCLSGLINKGPHIEYIKNVVSNLSLKTKDKKLHFINVKVMLKKPEDFGCQYHPNIEGHKKIADFLEPIIKKVMKWK